MSVEQTVVSLIVNVGVGILAYQSGVHMGRFYEWRDNLKKNSKEEQ